MGNSPEMLIESADHVLTSKLPNYKISSLLSSYKFVTKKHFQSEALRWLSTAVN